MSKIAKDCPKCGEKMNVDLDQKEIECGACGRNFAIKCDRRRVALGDNSSDVIELKQLAPKTLQQAFKIVVIIMGLVLVILMTFSIKTFVEFSNDYKENASRTNSQYDTNFK